MFFLVVYFGGSWDVVGQKGYRDELAKCLRVPNKSSGKNENPKNGVLPAKFSRVSQHQGLL